MPFKGSDPFYHGLLEQGFMMRYFNVAAMACLMTATSTGYCDSPAERKITEPKITAPQQKLIEAQLEDDRLIAPVRALMNKMTHSDASVARIAADRMVQFNRAREERAASYLKLTGVTLPLLVPFTEQERAELESFSKGVFQNTERGDLIRHALEADQKLKLEAEAKAAFAKIPLTSIDDELTAAQRAELVDFERKYATTESSLEAGRYLKADANRRIRVVARDAGLFNPEEMERQASRRLQDLNERFGDEESTRFRRALAEIVQDYPATQAGQQSSKRLAEVERKRQATAEQSRLIRNYWDAVYPSRVANPQ